MSKTLEVIKLKEPTKLTGIRIDDGGVSLLFENGEEVELSDHHSQDCCESVYADWKAFSAYKSQIVDHRYSEIEVRGIDGEGVMFCFSDYPLQKVFVPCYDIQNGYYSSDLDLTIKHNGVAKTININKYEDASEG